MPRTGATIYDLLLSCPSDVIDLKDIVKECVDDFNRLYGSINNIKIEVKHWTTDSYPQLGGRPQELLNNQFIHECDACVALFANKFGTPTEKYESGTEEEIEDMISSGKQVFLYFIERPVDPNMINIEELSKVRKFKEKYTDKGIYWPIKSNDEFRKMFLNHLTLYFLQLVLETTSSSLLTNTPKLEFVMSNGTNDAQIEYSHFYNSKMFHNMSLSILELINNIKSIELCECIDFQGILLEKSFPNELLESKSEYKDSKEVSNLKLTDQFKEISNLAKKFTNLPGFQQIEYKAVEINNTMRSEIMEYCNSKGIEIEEQFWYLGELKEEFSAIVLSYYSVEKLKGTEEEKRKYKLIKELWSKIHEYKEYSKFYSEVDAMPRLNCVIANKGTTYDEDIDIKIIIPRECILRVNELPVPGIPCIDEINKKNLCNYLFCGKKTDLIDVYSEYQLQVYTEYDRLMDMMPLGQESVMQKYEREKQKYIKRLNDIFCYNYYKRDESDVLVFNIKYLKQNTNMYLPSILFFKNIPEYIKYEIRSKHLPEVVDGILEPYELDNSLL